MWPNLPSISRREDSQSSRRSTHPRTGMVNTHTVNESYFTWVILARGNLQDLSTRESVVAERQKIGRFFYRFQGGESGADVYDRVSSFMDSLFREMSNCLMPNNNICIVSHGLFMRLFLMRFYRWSVEKFHTLENFDNCGCCILERDDVDGSFVLTTDLATYPEDKPARPLRASFSQHSFQAEAHPTIHSETIGQSAKKKE